MTPCAEWDKRGLLVVLSGPSGVGKGTVMARAMVSRGRGGARLCRSVSVTTREPRDGERPGRDYIFLSPTEFERMAANGDLLEWATYLDDRYGTPRAWVDEQLAAGWDVVLEIEVQGAMQVRSRRPDAVLIYMRPPSWRALERRLAHRRSESLELQQRRLQVARQEMSSIPHYDYLIVNDRVDRAARDLLCILQAERCRIARVGDDVLEV